MDAGIRLSEITEAIPVYIILKALYNIERYWEIKRRMS